MKKTKTLSSLAFAGGMYVAWIYDRERHYYSTEKFLWYSKKEVVQKLRDAGVIVPAAAIR